MYAPFLILGSGYTGRYLVTEASSQGRAVLSTSREPARQLAHVPPTQRLKFDLAQPDTWTGIPAITDLMVLSRYADRTGASLREGARRPPLVALSS